MWIQSFLQDQTQRVGNDGVASESSAMLSGVSQGRVLHKILFLIINDFPTKGRTRASHQQKYMYLWSKTNYMEFIFFPRTIPRWNSLPAKVVEFKTAQEFKAALAQV